MQRSGVALVFTLLLVAAVSYGYVLSDPVLVDIDRRTGQKPYITRDYYPDWLSSSESLSGFSLYYTRNWVVGLGSINEQIEYIKRQLVMSCINPEDPVLFSDAELSALNAGIPGRPERRPFEEGPFEEAPSEEAPSEEAPSEEAPSEEAPSLDNVSRGSPTARISELFDRAGGIDDIQQLFAEQKLTPLRLVEDIYLWYEKKLPESMKDVLIEQDKSLAMKMAEASDLRWRNCTSAYLGVIEECKKKRIIRELEGIPIAVSSEINVAGYYPTAGLRRKMAYHPTFYMAFENTESEVVQRLKSEGVIILGSTHQHILGLGATGENPQFPRISNRFSPFHVAGGSSSGSALMAALGLSPLTVGTDNGGSVSISASLNGLPGLKPTTDKLSTKNYDYTVPALTAIGLIGNRFKDIALGYQVSSGLHPTPQVAEALKTLKIGLDPDWLEHADKEVSEKTFECLDRLGTQLKKLQSHKDSLFVRMQFMPENFRKRLWATHMILFGHGAAEGKFKFVGKTDGMDLPHETEMALLMGKALSYEQVQRAKQNQRDLVGHFENNIFSKVDVIAMPTTLTPATAKLKHWLTNTAGELNFATTYLLAFNTSLANLTGSPRITIPCGFNHEDLPFGLQLMGAFHSEYLLLALGNLLEQEMDGELRKKADSNTFLKRFKPYQKPSPDDGGSVPYKVRKGDL
ncbi:amidase [Endozoicomonas sp. ALC020]|uniref:amidase n=1 Tax=unclassified Endozoicomonas TaxID=2644528 RepID=UPI003BAEF628